MLFEHTHKTRSGTWRGWLRDGQTLEIAKGGGVGAGIIIHARDDDMTARRMFWLAIGFWQIYFPLGIIQHRYDVGEEPQWSIRFGRRNIHANWNERFKIWHWPFRTELLEWEYLDETGNWRNARGLWKERKPEEEYVRRPEALRIVQPYTYRLRSGKIQRRQATIIKERWKYGRHILSRFGWPTRTEYAIDIEFDGEVGERTGSWKGGVIGCGFTMQPGETTLDALRRMESERVFA